MEQTNELVTQKLFTSWDKAGIKYLHWKSNAQLRRGLRGETDLDIFLKAADLEQAQKQLKKQHWLKVLSSPHFAGIQDWIGFCEDTGGLLHVHLHTWIPVGGSRNKPFSLPINEQIFLNYRQSIGGVWIAHPQHEFTLLALRILMKTTPKHVIKVLLRGDDIYPDNIRREIDWLIDAGGALATIKECVPEALEPFVILVKQRVERGTVTIPFLIWAALHVRLHLLGTFSFSRWLQSVKPRKKRLTNHGVLISLLGVDGCGKSSMSEEVVAWLGWKIDVSLRYLGMPKKSGTGRLLHQCTRQFGGTRFFYLYAAWYRWRQSVLAHRAADVGSVVITDRYPATFLWSDDYTVDGPRINGWGSGLEQWLYRHIQPAQTSLYLKASLDTLAERDTKIGASERIRKYNLYEDNKKNFDHIIDADQIYEKVLLETKKVIWKQLCTQ